MDRVSSRVRSVFAGEGSGRFAVAAVKPLQGFPSMLLLGFYPFVVLFKLLARRCTKISTFCVVAACYVCVCECVCVCLRETRSRVYSVHALSDVTKRGTSCALVV